MLEDGCPVQNNSKILVNFRNIYIHLLLSGF